MAACVGTTLLRCIEKERSSQAVGGCQDVSFIIDFLESYLFPHGEKQIDEWILTGYSLGGNVTWRMVLTGACRTVLHG